jgi:hypothetical protein
MTEHSTPRIGTMKTVSFVVLALLLGFVAGYFTRRPQVCSIWPAWESAKLTKGSKCTFVVYDSTGKMLTQVGEIGCHDGPMFLANGQLWGLPPAKITVP